MSDNPYVTDSEDLIPLDRISKVTDLPDGSSVFDVQDEHDIEIVDEPIEKGFHSNLAEDLERSKLDMLAIELIDGINDDKASRKEWESAINLALKYLGFKIEEFRTVPFMYASSAYDSTLAIALYRFVSTAYAELYPAAGPARVEIFGTPTQQAEEAGERVKAWMNFYLTKIDNEYYRDSMQHILYTGFFGSCAKKVYQDPTINMPRSRMVKSFDLIYNKECTSLESSPRVTQVLQLTKKEVIQNEINGNYLPSNLDLNKEDSDFEESDIKKTIDGIEGTSETSSTVSEEKKLIDFYECHVDLEPSKVETDYDDEDKLPKPYVVTICNNTKKIVSIRRNWKEQDNSFKKIQYFVNSIYLPGFGMYGVGLAHLIGSNQITLTTILRQLIDAGLLKTFPGGLMKKGMRLEENDKAIGPSEFREVETDSPLQESIMPMPYAEPSSILFQLLGRQEQQTALLAATGEREIPEIGANAPVGTTLALLEVANKVQSSVLRSLHNSLGIELQLLAKLFGEYLPDEPYPFSVPGGEMAIMKQDFSNMISITPVSDPNVLTSTHRLIRAEAILKTAMGAPELHNMPEVYKMFYMSMNVENVDKIMAQPPKPISLDPMTENANMSIGKPVEVTPEQDHESHIIVHKPMLQDPMILQNPMVKAAVEMHIQKHKVYSAMKQMFEQQQQQLFEYEQILHQQVQAGNFVAPQAYQELENGTQSMQMQMQQLQQMPIDQLLIIPEIQNIIARNDAREVQEIQQKQEQMMAEQQANQVTDVQALMAEINQRREASALKDEGDKLKAQYESYKAQLDFEKDMEKLRVDERMARERNETNLEIEHLKHEGERNDHV